MNIQSLWAGFKGLVKIARKKDLKHAINRLWFYILWDDKKLREFFLIKLFPWAVTFPPFVEVETTTRCNLRCIMCEHTYWKEKCRDMTFEEFKGIVDQFKLRWIGVTGIGESFLNKDFMKMLEYIKSKSILVELFDTFYFLDEEMVTRLLQMGIDRILISFDAATKETYEKIRVGSKYERVVKNIKKAFQLKKEMNDDISKINFHYIISKPNLHEVPKYIDFVNEMRQGQDTFIMFTALLHAYDEIEQYVTEIPQEIIDETEKKAKKAGIPITWNMNVPSKKDDISHCTSWIQPFIFSSGEVIPCCAGNEANKRDFQKKYSFGNVFKSSFRDIWNGEKYKRFREKIHNGETPIHCRDCSIYDTNYETDEEFEKLYK
ncbi:MAG: radical SAM protein [Candidatus Eremiobacteraeota bacterium]|nr:radical SAM protein [Candidatus Eremiobacteraeota bacterium]